MVRLCFDFAPISHRCNLPRSIWGGSHRRRFLQSRLLYSFANAATKNAGSPWRVLARKCYEIIPVSRTFDLILIPFLSFVKIIATAPLYFGFYPFLSRVDKEWNNSFLLGQKMPVRAWNWFQRLSLNKWYTNFRLEHSVRKNRTAFSDVPLLPEIFHWNHPKSRVPFTFQAEFPESCCKW